MYKKIVRTGDLNKRIIIQKVAITKNDNEFPVEEWNDYITLWCSISNLYGREYWSALAVQQENTVNFAIRYCKYLDSSKNIEGKNTTKIFRIKFNNSIFNINFIDDVKLEHEFMEIKGVS